MVLDWAKDWVMDKVYGVARTGIEAGGNMAGNAVGGVGTLIENSGRGVGQSTSGITGAIGGVGSYINKYGQGIIDSTAASGGGGSGGGEKKQAVNPTQATSKGASNAQKSLPTATSSVRSLASTAKPALKPNISSTPRPLSAPTKTPSPKPLSQPSKPPPPAPNRNLPVKKPQPHFPQKPAGTSSLTKISASASDRMSDGKIRVSAASRPRSAKSNIASGPVKPRTAQNNAGPKPLPRIAAGKNDRTPDGRIKISPQSRPRPVVSAR